MTERQEKIRKLVRENRGTTAKPEFLQRIAEALDEKVSENRLLDLVATDELRQSFGAGYKSSKDVREACFAHYFPKDRRDTVFQLLKCFSTKISETAAFALFMQSDLCGAFRIDAATALLKARALIHVDGNGLCVITANRQDGLMLDFNPDDEATCYELVIWGSSWPIRFLPCLSML